jgi:hypothetical protein
MAEGLDIVRTDSLDRAFERDEAILWQMTAGGNPDVWRFKLYDPKT